MKTLIELTLLLMFGAILESQVMLETKDIAGVSTLSLFTFKDKDVIDPAAESRYLNRHVIATDHVYWLGAPSFENSTPCASGTFSGLMLRIDIDKAGTIYYVVVGDGATAPTSAEVKAGTASGGGVAPNGNAAVTMGDFSHDFNVLGLNTATQYDVYVVAEDDDVSPNLQAFPTKIDVTTADVTDPVFFENCTPSISDLEGTNLTLNIDLNTAGAIWYVILADGATAPTIADVKAGTGSLVSGADIQVSDELHTINVSGPGLSFEAAYDFYILACEPSGMSCLSPFKIDLITGPNPDSILLTNDFSELAICVMDELNISWSIRGNIERVNVWLSLDNGSTYPISVATNVDSMFKSVEYTLPRGLNSASQVRIKVEDVNRRAVPAISDPFQIYSIDHCNACYHDTLIISDATIYSGNYHAVVTLISEGIIASDSVVLYKAGNSIQLLPNFEVKEGGALTTMIESCNGILIVDDPKNRGYP